MATGAPIKCDSSCAECSFYELKAKSAPAAYIANNNLAAPSAAVFDRCNFVDNNSTVPLGGGPRKSGIVAIDAEQVGSNALFQHCTFLRNAGFDVETNGGTAWSTTPPLALHDNVDASQLDYAEAHGKLLNETSPADEMPQRVKRSMLSLDDDELLHIQQVPLLLVSKLARDA